MSIAKQLYQLQEVDLELDNTERRIREIMRQLGESEALVRARSSLAAERQLLEDLRKQQRNVEHEIDDVTAKLTKAEEELYSGRIRNPKELSGLQHEVETIKAQRNQMESKELDIMEQAEQATKSLSIAEAEFKQVEDGWQKEQQKLSAELEKLKTVLADITQKRQQLASGIESPAADVYQELRKLRGTAVVRVERGICSGCRISLPVSELQRSRSGELVRCGSCGRILYLA